MVVKREIDIEAAPDEVWEAVSTDEGREQWLDDQRPLQVEEALAPERISWWWADDEGFSRVEIRIAAIPAGSRVTVIETLPTFPLFRLAATLLARVSA